MFRLRRRIDRSGWAMSPGRDRARRDLVEQRREQVEVAPVDDGQVDPVVLAELAGRVEPAEAAADDEDPMLRALRVPVHDPECIANFRRSTLTA